MAPGNAVKQGPRCGPLDLKPWEKPTISALAKWGTKPWEPADGTGAADVTLEGPSHAELELAAQRSVNSDILTQLKHEQAKSKALKIDLDAARMVLRREKAMHQKTLKQLAVVQSSERSPSKGMLAQQPKKEDKSGTLKKGEVQVKEALLDALEEKTQEAEASQQRADEAVAHLERVAGSLQAAREELERQGAHAARLEARLGMQRAEALEAVRDAAEREAALQAELAAALAREGTGELELRAARAAAAREGLLRAELEGQLRRTAEEAEARRAEAQVEEMRRTLDTLRGELRRAILAKEAAEDGAAEARAAEARAAEAARGREEACALAAGRAAEALSVAEAEAAGREAALEDLAAQAAERTLAAEAASKAAERRAAELQAQAVAVRPRRPRLPPPCPSRAPPRGALPCPPAPRRAMARAQERAPGDGGVQLVREEGRDASS